MDGGGGFFQIIHVWSIEFEMENGDLVLKNRMPRFGLSGLHWHWTHKAGRALTPCLEHRCMSPRSSSEKKRHLKNPAREPSGPLSHQSCLLC
jgi:hypothetical protein